MGQLHQMQITFMPEEDRLLFRVNTVGRHREEFRFWFTRRYVRILWQGLMNMLKQGQPGPAGGPPIAKQIAEEHRQVVQKADFQTAYQESSLFPLGEVPILLAKVGLGANAEGVPVLSMQPQQGQGIELSLNRQILHSFCRLLHEATTKAEWDLHLDFGEAEDLMSRLGLN